MATLSEHKFILFYLYFVQDGDPCVLDVMDSACGTIIERVLPHLPLVERVSKPSRLLNCAVLEVNPKTFF